MGNVGPTARIALARSNPSMGYSPQTLGSLQLHRWELRNLKGNFYLRIIEILI